MRQQLVSGLLAISVGCIVSQTVLAAEKSPTARKTPSAQAMSASAASSAPADAAAREQTMREQALQDWRAKLTGTRWELTVTPTRVSGAEPETDVLVFSERSVGSENLVNTGFADADTYALYAPTEQSVAWEAMQVKEEKGTRDMAIWRGEVIGATMQGALVKQRKRADKETTEQFTFTGRRLEAAPEPAQPVAGESVPAEPSSAAVDSPSAAGSTQN